MLYLENIIWIKQHEDIQDKDKEHEAFESFFYEAQY